jgi:hypothetical protein
VFERILVKRMRSNHYRQITVDLVMEPSRSSERVVTPAMT